MGGRVQVEATLITFIYDKLQNKVFLMKRGNQHQIMTSQEDNWVVVWLGIIV
jgi:hypothetical protein